MPSPVKLFQAAIPGATNDEALELTYRLLENLAQRCENAADIAIDSDNRDVENEALVFIKEVDSLMPNLSAPERLKEPWHVVYDADRDLATAIRNRRQALTGGRTVLESFSRRRNRRVATAWEVQRRREGAKREQLLKRANVTSDRVFEALQTVAMEGPVQAMHVAIAMLPELTDPAVIGRQTVIASVAKQLRDLAKGGGVTQIRPSENDHGRKTCRYGLASVDA